MELLWFIKDGNTGLPVTDANEYTSVGIRRAVDGYIYNWFAIAGVYDRSSYADYTLRKTFAPSGTHLPTKADFETLINCLGGRAVAGGNAKTSGTTYWNTPNPVNNNSGFNAKGAGSYSRGTPWSFQQIGGWWSIPEYPVTRFYDWSSSYVYETYYRDITFNNNGRPGNDIYWGWSVRLINI
jgi:uncharacterized protein (TIGR02145 family)